MAGNKIRILSILLILFFAPLVNQKANGYKWGTKDQYNYYQEEAKREIMNQVPEKYLEKNLQEDIIRGTQSLITVAALIYVGLLIFGKV
jgi:hypothetical protein